MTDFLRLVDVNAGGSRLKKGPGNFTPNVCTYTSLEGGAWNGVLGRACDEAKNQWRKASFHWMGSRHSVNEGIGKEFCRKGNLLKTFQPFSESPTLKLKFSALIPFPNLCSLSGPVLRDTARLSQRYPPIARYGVIGVSTWPIGCDTPSPFSGRCPWRACELEVWYPSSKRVSQRYWRDTLWKQGKWVR